MIKILSDAKCFFTGLCEVTVTEAGGWKASWTDLPAYEGGKLITYSVREETIEDYSAGAPVRESVGFKAGIIWKEGAVKPDSERITLVNENGDSSSYWSTFSEDNGWTGVFDGNFNEQHLYEYSVSAFPPLMKAQKKNDK